MCVPRGELRDEIWAVAVQLATEVKRLHREALESRLLTISDSSVSPFKGGGREVDVGGDAAPLAGSSIVPNPSEVVENETVEVAHEALLLHWVKLKNWVRDDQRFILWRQRLGERLRDHHEAGGKSDTLLSGGLLTQAQSWFDVRLDDLNDAERRFIDASRQNEEEEEAKEQKRKRELEAALIAEMKARKRAEKLLSIAWRSGVAAAMLALLAFGGVGLAVTYYKQAELANIGLDKQLRISELEKVIAIQFTIAQNIFSRLAVACTIQGAENPSTANPLRRQAVELAKQIPALQGEVYCDRLVNVANSTSIWQANPRKGAKALKIHHPEMQRFVKAIEIGQGIDIFNMMRAQRMTYNIDFVPETLLSNLESLSDLVEESSNDSN